MIYAQKIFDNAIRLHQAGHLKEAFKLYKSIYNYNPKDPNLLYHLGILRYQQGILPDAKKYLHKAIIYQPNYFDAHLLLGLIHLKQKHLTTAKKHLILANQLQMDNIIVINYLIIVCFMSDMWDEADKWLEKSASLHTTELQAYNSLSIALKELDKVKFENIELSTLSFTLVNLLFKDTEFHKIFNKILNSSIEDVVVCFVNGELNTLIKNKLFKRVLKNDVVTVAEYECFLTKLRNIILYYYLNTYPEKIDDDWWSFITILAEYVWMTEYVFNITKQEVNKLQVVIKRQTIPAHAIVSLGDNTIYDLLILFLYYPHYTLKNHNTIFTLPIETWPEYARELILKFKDFYIENELKADIQALTPVDNEVSQKVKEQYEKNPYPRWKTFKAFNRNKYTFGDIVKLLNPYISVSGFLFNPVKMLIAGCGTGKEVMSHIYSMDISEMVAIDLSKASLAYAKRKINEINMTINIQFMQADILELDHKGLLFDVVCSSGVLHHMSDPMKGWRILTNVLRPGGLMRVALYSEKGRESITYAREFISERMIRAKEEDMKLLRHEIIEDDKHPLRNLIYWNDFYTMSMFRDLVFHDQEHHFSIPKIRLCLEELGLQFVGFSGISNDVSKEYRRLYPDDPYGLNLNNWEIFELQNPTAFMAMYQMTLLKKEK